MKKLFVLFISMSVILLANATPSHQSAKNVEAGTDMTAVEYNDSIVRLQMNILEPTLELMTLESEDILGDLEKVIIETERNIRALEAMEVYTGGEAMKSAAQDLFEFYLKTMKGSWKEALTLYVEKGNSMTDEDYAVFSELLTKPGVEEVKYDDAFAQAQMAFAKANNIKIEENPLQKEIDASGK